jgi:hypothetical protein
VRRRLSPTERFLWAAGESLPVNFAATGRIQGRVTPNRLREALAAVRRRHPLLGVRIVGQGRWRAWLTTDDVPDPELRVIRADTPGCWARVVEEELQRRFDPATGPLARFVLVEAGDCFDLVGVYHHLVADVLSAGVVLRDILQRLAGTGTGPGSGAPVLAPPADDLLPGRRANPTDLLGLVRILRAPVRPPRPAGPLAHAGWSLDDAMTAALLTRCRAEGTTLQSVLCAAFARALNHHVPQPARIAVAADLRRILVPAPHEAVGLYATSFSLPVDGTGSRDLWSLARDVRRVIHRRLSPGRLRAPVRALRLLPFLPRATISAALLRSERRGARFDVSLSNTRLMLPRDYGALRLSAIHASAHTSLSGAPLVLVTGFGGRLFCTVTSTDGDGAEQLCERAMGHLTDGLSPEPSDHGLRSGVRVIEQRAGRTGSGARQPR